VTLLSGCVAKLGMGDVERSALARAFQRSIVIHGYLCMLLSMLCVFVCM